MKFVDEATINVKAGKGGNGSASFRREKYIPFGGPDGGDGGKGGSIYLIASSHINTLIDFRYTRAFKAQNGDCGHGRQCRGKDGEDVYIKVPVGTIVKDHDTGEILVEMMENEQVALIARGGSRGLGNVHFKSSTNRAPQRTTKGKPGDERNLDLELQLLADVGVVGFPNAGKSTLICAVSNAMTKVADYPFTTTYPKLGTVSVDAETRFVIADIPGLVKGAHTGAGLGLQFLKHLSRTRLLLHVIDMLEDNVQQQLIDIEQELQQFSETLYQKPRWVILNKADCVDIDTINVMKKTITELKGPEIPILVISAAERQGTEQLCKQIALTLARMKESEASQEKNNYLA